jgi:hypothetical protein
LYHLYCFQVYSYTTGTTQYLFHNQNGSKIVLCANNCRPQMELFCTIETFFVPTTSSVPHCTTNGFFQDGICVVWVCFVPFRTVFVWCGFVLYHLYCFQVYSYTTGTTQYLFHNQNGSKIVLCANNCRPQMELFCTIETFFVPQSDSIPHFMFQGSHMSQEGLKQVSHPLIFEYWARDSDLGFRSQRRGVA